MNPITLSIDLNLDDYLVRFHGYDRDGEEVTERQTIEDLIIERAATQLGQQAIRDETKSAYRSLASRIGNILDEEIRTRVAPLVEEALTHPFRRTNSYGEPAGAETTLREQIVKTATDYLTKSSGDRYDRDKGTAVQQLIAAEVKKAVDAELKDALAKAKADVAAAVKGHAATMIQQTITSLAGVK